MRNTSEGCEVVKHSMATIEMEVRTIRGDRLVGGGTMEYGTYAYQRVCQVLRSCCMKGYLDTVSSREMPQALDDVRRTFCPGCHLRPGVCRGIE